MRKTIARLAILAALTLGGVGVAGASSAMAANCSVTESTTFWDGGNAELWFSGQLYNCSDVDQMDFKKVIPPGYPNTGCDTCATLWDDFSVTPPPGGGTYYVGTVPSDPDVQHFGVPGHVLGSAAARWDTSSWCGGAVHQVRTQFVFRIHSAAQGSWGPYHYRQSSKYLINC